MDPAQKETATMTALPRSPLPRHRTTGPSTCSLPPWAGAASPRSGTHFPGDGARGLHTSKLMGRGRRRGRARGARGRPRADAQLIDHRGRPLLQAPRGAGRGRVGLLDAVPRRLTAPAPRVGPSAAPARRWQRTAHDACPFRLTPTEETRPCGDHRPDTTASVYRRDRDGEPVAHVALHAAVDGGVSLAEAIRAGPATPTRLRRGARDPRMGPPDADSAPDRTTGARPSPVLPRGVRGRRARRAG